VRWPQEIGQCYEAAGKRNDAICVYKGILEAFSDPAKDKAVRESPRGKTGAYAQMTGEVQQALKKLQGSKGQKPQP
jgi:hypothetical protein